MAKRVLIICLCLLLFNLLHAQSPVFTKKWDKRYGGSMDDVISTFHLTPDSGYVFGGTSYSGMTGDKTQDNHDTSLVTSDFWIVKSDSLGQKIWDKRFGGLNNELLEDLDSTSDGGYIAGGQAYSGISGEKSQPNWDPSQGSNDYWIIKIDSIGNKQWDKRFGGATFELLKSVRQTPDGGYILGGSSFSGISGDKTQASQGSWDYWLVKTNASGIKVWDKRFGGTSDEFATCMELTSDGGYLVGGYSKSQVGGDKTQICQGTWDYWVVKINSSGTKVWDKTFGGDGVDWMFTLTKCFDGGFLLGGQSFSGVSGDKSEPNHDLVPSGSDYWVVRIDSTGNKMWDRTYGATETEELIKLSETKDHGFLMSGESYSPADGDKSEPNLGIEQGWILKTDSAGNKQWDKTIFSIGHDESSTAIQVTDNCYAITNYTAADSGGYKSEMSRGAGDYWIVKLCIDEQTSLQEINLPDEILHIYPNPTSGVIKINLPQNETLIYWDLYDISGKLLSTRFTKSFGDLLNIENGIYFVKAVTNKSIRNTKLIKVN